MTTKMASTLLQCRVELLVMGWIRLFIEDKVENIPVECKLICKDFFGALIDSKILKIDEENLLLKYIKQQTKQDWSWKLIYRGTEQGFCKEDFYEHCQDKGNTVVIVHNEEDRVIGGYTPCKWVYNQDNDTKFAKDETLTSFLFVLRPISQMMKLKTLRMDNAVSYRRTTAFDFGCNDFFFYSQGVYTWLNDCCYEGCHGMTGMQFGHFIPTEIEIFQLY